MGVVDYKNDVIKLSTEEMYNKYIVGGEVWIFKDKYEEQWYKKYDEFRLFISKKLGVHYNDIAIAGSAKLGFSINPKKNFKLFDENSDIDIVIISQNYFYKFWDAYRYDSYNEIRLKEFDKVIFYIFRKYLTMDGFTNKNPTYAKWLKQTQGFEKDIQLKFGLECPVTYRIFESWDAAKDYYMQSIRKSKKSLEEV